MPAAPTLTPTRAHRFPLLERPGAAVVLAAVAGLLNAWTFAHTQSFATVQSGNLISIGYFLAEGDMTRIVAAAASVLAFALGACVCSLFVLWSSRRRAKYSTSVLTFEIGMLGGLIAVFLLVPGLDPWWLAWAISFLAGVQGNAFHREAGMLYGNIAVTFVVQMTGSLLGRAIGHRIASDGQPHLRPAGEYALVLLAFAAAGGVGFWFDSLLSVGTLTAASLLLLGLLLPSIRTHGPVDPEQNTPTP